MHAQRVNTAEEDLRLWIQAKARPYKILMIDDDPDLFDLVRLGSEKFNRVIIPAGSGEDGLRLFSEDKPDMVWLDIKMPGTDGLEVFRSIRSMDKIVPCVIVSGYFNEAYIRAISRIGITLMLQKPDQITPENVDIVMRHFNVAEMASAKPPLYL